MNREILKSRIKEYDASNLMPVTHALAIIEENNSIDLTNTEIGIIWEYISKAIDISFSDDDNHDAWKLEVELKEAYRHE